MSSEIEGVNELLPCPHCGEQEHLYPGYHWPGTGDPYCIDCLGCGADFTPREGMDVIAMWNRRTNPSSIRNAALNEAADKLEAIMEDRRSRKITRGHDYIASCASTIRMLKDQS